ncbi:ComEC/Rec2 family competence protein [Leucobacter insecticola]|uniref:ComEC/Rec2 family competence protein n=1 Tax=Leucobacter insecticola TaxID=2714934 RepID=UPI001FCC0004|nr:MBL fold metallo-hydrolase [Leucobacter insecticola]
MQVLPILAWALHTGRLPWPGTARVRGRVPWVENGESPRVPRAVRGAVAVLLCAACGIFAGVTLVSPLTQRASVPGDWAVVACDVHQGDAILLREPGVPNSTILVDTGDSPELIEDCLARFGVHRIRLLVLTHDDQDHVGALSAVAAITEAALVSPPVAEYIPGSEGVAGASPRPLLQELEEYGVPYRVGVEGMRSDDPGVRWEILAPEPGRVVTDENATSLVLLASAGGLTTLLLADTGENEHRALLARGVGLRADIVKVAHHGSRNQDSRLLAATAARFGLVSVGAENRYGHPNEVVLTAMRDAGIIALRTDELGSIALRKVAGEIHAWSVRAPEETGEQGREELRDLPARSGSDVGATE